MAPEIIHRQPYGKPVDVWGAGVLVYILISGSLPFFGTKNSLFDMIVKGAYSVCTVIVIIYKMLYNWMICWIDFCPSSLKVRGVVWDEISADCKDLIHRMLDLDQERRITIEQALQHPWLRVNIIEMERGRDMGEGVEERWDRE